MESQTPARIDESAVVDETATVGPGSLVWGLAQLRENVVVGAQCIVGRGAYVGSGVRIGDRCKIQNNALLYEPAVLDDGVFVGPGVILTNDSNPRAVNPDGSLKSGADWHPVGVVIGEGASIGAGAVCVAPIEIGRWATVAAGAVVTSDVADHQLVAGVPARPLGWVGRAGIRLVQDDAGQGLVCPETGERYIEDAGRLRMIEATTQASNSQ